MIKEIYLDVRQCSRFKHSLKFDEDNDDNDGKSHANCAASDYNFLFFISSKRYNFMMGDLMTNPYKVAQVI